MKRIANSRKEGKLKKQGFKYIAGVDEVGCGAWAGPIFACALILSPKFKKSVCDSKQLKESKREEYAKIIKKKNKRVGIGYAKREEIDSLGLNKARTLAILRAIKNLPQKPDYVLLDGLDFIKNLWFWNDGGSRFPSAPFFTAKKPKILFQILNPSAVKSRSNCNRFLCPYEFTVCGDEKIKSIACASIIAKTERDKVMRQLAKKYPEYKFERNKGYGTKEHLAALFKHGLTPLHRKSYKPIKKLLKTQRAF